MKAAEEEFESLMKNKTWSLTELPSGRVPISCNWIFKQKQDGRYKARLVARGFTQIKGFDYNETFSPTVRADWSWTGRCSISDDD